MGDVWSREVVARVQRSSFGVQFETMFAPARVEDYHTLHLSLFCFVDAAADDNKWRECIEIKLMPRHTEGINKQRIGVRFP